MIAVPDGVILEHELAGERRIGIERHWGRLRELFVRERAKRGRSCRAVFLEQLDGGFSGDVRILGRMTGVHLVDVGHRHAGYRLAFRDGQRELNFERVHAGDVVHDDADGAAVVWDAGLPFGVGERGREGSQGSNSVFEAVGQSSGALASGTGGRTGLR